MANIETGYRPELDDDLSSENPLNQNTYNPELAAQAAIKSVSQAENQSGSQSVDVNKETPARTALEVAMERSNPGGDLGPKIDTQAEGQGVSQPESQSVDTSNETPLRTAREIAMERTNSDGDLGPKIDTQAEGQGVSQPENQSNDTNQETPLKTALEIAMEKTNPGTQSAEQLKDKPDTESKPEQADKQNFTKKVFDKLTKGWNFDVNWKNPEVSGGDKVDRVNNETTESKESNPEIRNNQLNFADFLKDSEMGQQAHEVAKQSTEKDFLKAIGQIIKDLIKLLGEISEEEKKKNEALGADKTTETYESKPVDEASNPEEEQTLEEKEGLTTQEKKDLWKQKFLEAGHINLPEKNQGWLESDKNNEPTGNTRTILSVNWEGDKPTIQFEGLGVARDGRLFTRKTNMPLEVFMKSSFEGEIRDGDESAGGQEGGSQAAEARPDTAETVKPNSNEVSAEAIETGAQESQPSAASINVPESGLNSVDQAPPVISNFANNNETVTENSFADTDNFTNTTEVAPNSLNTLG